MRRRQGSGRRAVTLVENMVVLPVFLTLVLGMVDLAVGVLHYHLVVDAARAAARQAMVHGSQATQLGPWGPQQVGPLTAQDNHPLVVAILPEMSCLDDGATVTAVWPDGDNQRDSRVCITVQSVYQPALTYLFGNVTFNLSASSTMPIAH